MGWAAALAVSAGGCHLVLGLEEFSDAEQGGGGGVRPATCGNGVRDADETATDCGGSCGPCANGQGCGVGTDCQSQVCAGGSCRAPSCTDGVKNGDELGVDCRGSCVEKKCGPEEACNGDGDCKGGLCEGGKCTSTCTDEKRNGDETATDCGGPECNPCELGQACTEDRDCRGTICRESACSGYNAWSKHFGEVGTSPGYPPLSRVATDPSGNTALLCSFAGEVNFGGATFTRPPNGGYALALAKFGTSGRHTWSRPISAEAAIGWAIATDESSNIFVTGGFGGALDFGGEQLNSAGDGDIFVAKLSASGDRLWSRRFGDIANQFNSNIAVDNQGNAIIAGAFSGTLDFDDAPRTGSSDVFLAKLDGLGHTSWSNKFGDAATTVSNNELNDVVRVAVDTMGNILVAGSYQGTINLGGMPLASAGDTDVFVAKFRPTGEHLWSKRFGGTGAQTVSSVATDASGNAYLSGVFTGTMTFDENNLIAGSSSLTYVAQLDPSGGYVWATQFINGYLAEGSGLTVGSTGDVIITGSFQETVNVGGGPLMTDGARGMYVARYSATGVHIWSAGYNGVAFPTSISADRAGNAVISGFFRDELSIERTVLATPSNSFFLAKFYEP